jgi:hypothetical protein
MSEYSSRPVDTFSIVFNDKKFDERDYSLVAKKNTKQHTELELELTDLSNIWMSILKVWIAQPLMGLIPGWYQNL